jgi:hypothetical protein
MQRGDKGGEVVDEKGTLLSLSYPFLNDSQQHHCTKY